MANAWTFFPLDGIVGKSFSSPLSLLFILRAIFVVSCCLPNTWIVEFLLQDVSTWA